VNPVLMESKPGILEKGQLPDKSNHWHLFTLIFMVPSKSRLLRDIGVGLPLLMMHLDTALLHY